MQGELDEYFFRPHDRGYLGRSEIVRKRILFRYWHVFLLFVEALRSATSSLTCYIADEKICKKTSGVNNSSGAGFER